MIRTNLIIVDGICGSGKSTLSQLICLNLAKQGVKSSWLYEHECPHPVCDSKTMAALDAGILRHDIYRNALSKWKKLAASLDGTKHVLIVESALFQIFAGMPFLLGMKREEIVEHVHKVDEVLARLNPLLIYLYQDDVSGAIEKVCRARGNWFRGHLVEKLSKAPGGKWGRASGFKGVLKYFADLRAMTDDIIQGLEMRVLRVENSDSDYERCNKLVAKFLGLQKLSWPRTVLKNIRGLCGSYKAVSGEDVLQIVSDGRNLLLGENGAMRLIQQGSNNFVVQGMCMEISFTKRRDGSASTMECKGNLPGLCLKWLKV